MSFSTDYSLDDIVKNADIFTISTGVFTRKNYEMIKDISLRKGNCFICCDHGYRFISEITIYPILEGYSSFSIYIVHIWEFLDYAKNVIISVKKTKKKNILAFLILFLL